MSTDPDYTPFLYEARPDGTIKIVGTRRNLKKVVLPAEIDGKAVVEIGDSAFRENSSITGALFQRA